MMFYNGFNLMLDLIFCAITALVVYRFAWFDGYSAGYQDSEEHSLSR